jgi:hypothetical protein
MAVLPTDAWDALWVRLEVYSSALEFIGVTAPLDSAMRAEARTATQQYFREARPALGAARLSEELLRAFDALMQDLLRAANTRSPKVGPLLKVLRDAAELRTDVEVAINQAIGEEALRQAEGTAYSSIEQRIIETLNALVPTAALSYTQALRDLTQIDRVSFRGPALELREALREILDHLAPDEAVSEQPGFKLEDGQRRPTMRQKALFILRSRGMAKTALEAPRDAVEIIENSASSLARSTYGRSALSSHVASSRAEVQQFKMYLDSVLADLLKLHVPPVAPSGGSTKPKA